MLSQVLLLLLLGATDVTSLPNIILLVADDVGWNDVSWNNPDIITPNLQAMADNGVTLNASYVQPVCTPTRASFLTGYYPYRMGLQSGAISRQQPKFLSTNYTTLAEKLNAVGYASHVVGKWHLGHCDWSYTPTYRGFTSHRGMLLGSGDHYTKTTGGGYDFRNNETVDYTYDDTHSTEAYTQLAEEIINDHDENTPLFLYMAYQAGHTPLQADQPYIDMYSSVVNDDRRVFSAMMTQLDDSVGRVKAALEAKGILNNSVVVFISDNGGTGDGGNNYPLAGKKGSLSEGGTRTPAFVYSDMLDNTGYTHPGMIHAVDWHATFLELAGITPDPDIDGVSQWNMLKYGDDSARDEFVYNVNSAQGVSAIRWQSYKLTEGMQIPTQIPVATTNRRKREVAGDDEEHIRVKRAGGFKMFNIDDDPYETTDISGSNRAIFRQMKLTLAGLKQNYEVDAIIVEDDPAAHHSNYGGVWTPGWCQGGL